MMQRPLLGSLLLSIPLASIAATAVAIGVANAQARFRDAAPPIDRPAQVMEIPPDEIPQCPLTPTAKTVELRKPIDPQNRQALEALSKAVSEANTTVLVGPDVVLDFSAAPDLLPLRPAACVTITSVDSFQPGRLAQIVGPRAQAAARAGAPAAPGAAPRDQAAPATTAERPPVAQPIATPGPGRTPHSFGPLLKFGKHPENVAINFFKIACEAGDRAPPDHVRISGLRIEGPSLGQQTDDHQAIRIHRCLDIEISNMEIYGWGGAGVSVSDDDADGPGQAPAFNREGERIGRPDQIRVLNNYIHHNQHESESTSEGTTWVFDEHAAGYGVVVGRGAWAQIHFNLFDVNRHAIAANGKAGGYDARWNLVLKGGGIHGRTFNEYTHQFDIHGTDGGSAGSGGRAGVQTWFFENSFQYLNGPAIKIRGRPHIGVYIGANVFAHEGLEDDWGDDAVHLQDRDDLDVIKLMPGNVIDYDSYGRYGVCDFDGDGIDDLFLATGKTWWFSSFGEFPWSYLSARTERIDQVRLGYFDNDLKCDVLTQSGNSWVIASGGTGAWTSIGSYGAPLAQVAFGRFDPGQVDSRPGATKRTTHAFRRLASGQWQVTSLTGPSWQNVQSSGQPMSSLRFGDFTGDGVTDVLGMNAGRWAISKSAREPWSQLNPTLGDNLAGLHIADLNNNGVDDLLRISAKQGPNFSITYTWHVSEDGRRPWRELKSYTWNWPRPNMHAFAGRFGEKSGGAVLTTAPDRIGHFFGPAEGAAGLNPDWRSVFAY